MRIFKRTVYYLRDKRDTLLISLILSVGLLVRIYNIYSSYPTLGRDTFWIWSRSLFSIHSQVHDSLYQLLLLSFDRIFFSAGYFAGFFNSLLDFEIKRITNVFDFILLGRFINVFLGLATIYVVNRIGKEFHDKKTGLLAALALALSEPHVFLSRSMNSDILVTLLIVISFLFSLKVFLCQRTKYYLISGFLIGLAVTAKYSGILAAIPLIAAHFLRKGRAGIYDKKIYLGLSFIVLGFLAGFPTLFSQAQHFFRNINWRIMMLSRSPVDYTINPWAISLKIICAGMEIPLFVLSALGLLYCLLNPGNKKNLLLVSFPILFYVAVILTKAIEERWLMPLFPFLLLSGAYFLVTFIDWVPGIHRRRVNIILSSVIFFTAALQMMRIFNIEASISKVKSQEMVDAWKRKFVYNKDYKRLAVDALCGGEILSALTGEDFVSSEILKPYMSFYRGPTLAISGEVFSKGKRDNPGLIIKVRRGSYYGYMPDISILALEGQTRYSIDVPVYSRWVTVRALSSDGVVSSCPVILNVRDSDIKGVNLVIY